MNILHQHHNARVSTVREKVREKNFFSRSGNCQGILKLVREFWNFSKSQGKVREFWKNLSSFDKTKDRLDELYYRSIGAHEKYKSLWEVVKMVLIMSHGQSTVERGFSTNKDILKTNMGKETLKAYRLVYDGLVNAPKMKTSEDKQAKDKQAKDKQANETDKGYQLDVSLIPVTKKMMEACRNARQKYDAYLEEQKRKKVASAVWKHVCDGGPFVFFLIVSMPLIKQHLSAVKLFTYIRYMNRLFKWLVGWLVVLRLNVPVNNFSVMSGRSHRFLGN